ncbi:hypothetical protein SEA_GLOBIWARMING_69 [Arthrobacter phage GlobiWarming]|nr:hypothetical protein SEA_GLOBIWARMING_69 [Arthrobacter phage GlobiWarming]
MSNDKLIPTRFGDELGKALCDRLGLNHNTTSQDWHVENINPKTVFVTMTTVAAIPVDQYNDLVKVAAERARQ